MASNNVSQVSEGGAALVDGDELQVGTTCNVMKLWEARSSDDRIVWLTEPPQPQPKAKHVAESPKFAITLLYGDAKSLGVHTLKAIVMRGPELHTLLEEVIPRLSTYYSEEQHGLVMRTPFRLLFWFYDHINAAAESAHGNSKHVATLLRDVLNEEFKSILIKRKELLAKQEMNFATLWTLFPPGSTCVTRYEGRVVAVRVTILEYKASSFGPPLYKIHHTMLEWDGRHFGWSESAADILEFSGRQKLKDLDIVPVEFCQSPELLTGLASRGRKFVELALKEPLMMSFSGETLDQDSSGLWWQAQQKKKMSERVVLDARAYDHYHRKIGIALGLKREELEEALKTNHKDHKLFLFCCPEFHCFALQRKEWARVWIDNLEEVVFNESAYSSLVLPGNYKKLLLAFAEAQIDSSGFDDVIAGKGQGILMLLAGPPGTGKTLTAEAMSEHMQRPLYSVSAGELGASTTSMEFKLDRVLQLATRWNAILLLDEADVFLENRTDHDLERNTVVSVFLKKLEYFRGIMFLTTNRIGSFDEAFRSRIHIAIQYPDLDASSRTTIWKNFLEKTKETYGHGVDVTETELDLLSQKKLNGREIRNIVKAAQLLASHSKEPLNKDHLDIVWKVEHEQNPWHEDRT